MQKITVVSKNPGLKVGEIYKGLAFGPPGYGPMPNQCFRVIAKATERNWIDYVVSVGEDRDWAEMLACINGPWYYYEIQTD